MALEYSQNSVGSSLVMKKASPSTRIAGLWGHREGGFPGLPWARNRPRAARKMGIDEVGNVGHVTKLLAVAN